MRVELLSGRREGCDDCHDDELREERRMRVELLSGGRMDVTTVTMMSSDRSEEWAGISL